jgi:protein involved in polysaccharide export with SLBB domain
MHKKVIFLFCLLTALLSFSQIINAQSFSPSDIRNLNVAELSDSEIRQADREIRERGLSLQEFEQLAIAQGASRAQVSQLVSRIRSVRAMGDMAAKIDRPETERLTPITQAPVFREFERESEIRVRDSLKIFGMDLFDQVAVSFEPSLNVPTPMDYTLGAGDEIVIDIWGAAEQTYRLTVSPEGNIRIPNLGPIHVNGLQVDDAERRVLNRLTNIYSGLRPNNPEQGNTFAQLTLGNVRSIKVTVIGEVRQPGTYTVSSLSTAFNALYASGGPSRNGTFRNVQIIRDHEVIETLDMYDFLVRGTQESNIRLRDQDVIKVDPYENRVHVWGETKRKGFFETREGETLEDLLMYAAGFTDQAYTRRLTLEGMTPTMRRVTGLLYPEAAGTEIRNGDKLRVGKILERFENRIQIDGAVFRPGTYELTEGLTLYDLINKADGLVEDAFMERGVIERLRENREPEMLNFHVGRLMNDPASYDIELRPDDLVRISNIFDLQEEFTIRIRGAVNNPQTLDFRENMTIEDAIFRAEGFRDNAAEYRVEVSRRITNMEQRVRTDRIAESYRFEVDENLGFSDEDRDFRLMPFDQIYVREKPNYQAQQSIRIEGEVQFPGEYVLSNRNMRLSEMIELAGGLSDYAYPQGASLQRRLTDDVSDELVFLEPEELSREQNVERSSVGIRLAEALQRPGSNQDLIMREGDVLSIPKELQTVRVEGEVLSPTSVRYDSGRSFRSYINAAGGVTDNAQRRRAYIVYANGEVDRSKQFLFFRNNPTVEPGATIVIPREPDTRELSAQERISILATLASTAATIALIVDRISR